VRIDEIIVGKRHHFSGTRRFEHVRVQARHSSLVHGRMGSVALCGAVVVVLSLTAALSNNATNSRVYV